MLSLRRCRWQANQSFDQEALFGGGEGVAWVDEDAVVVRLKCIGTRSHQWAMMSGNGIRANEGQSQGLAAYKQLASHPCMLHRCSFCTADCHRSPS